LTDGAGVPVWNASYSPFGQAQVDEDPDLNGIPVTFNPRFPGQYFDSETGFHYNYFRVYDPATGRYINSDPMICYMPCRPSYSTTRYLE
jgi:RHS repeat-associated protein